MTLRGVQGVVQRGIIKKSARQQQQPSYIPPVHRQEGHFHIETNMYYCTLQSCWRTCTIYPHVLQHLNMHVVPSSVSWIF